MGKKYLLYYAIAHAEFRYAELQSISELFDFTVILPEEEEARNPNRPFLIVELEDETHARSLARRCILVKYGATVNAIGPTDSTVVRAVYELWATGTTYGDLHCQMHLNEHLWRPFCAESFCFDVTAVNHKIPDARQKKIIEDFAYMEYTGEINIKNAMNVLTYLEECRY